MSGPGTNNGHGFVWPRPDGIRARCGGPGICARCSIDAVQYGPKVVPASENLDGSDKHAPHWLRDVLQFVLWAAPRLPREHFMGMDELEPYEAISLLAGRVGFRAIETKEKVVDTLPELRAFIASHVPGDA